MSNWVRNHFFAMPFGVMRKRFAKQGDKDDEKMMYAFAIGRLVVIWDVKP